MFKNYLKMAYSNLRENKLPSLINITGLSSAIACCIFAFVYGDFYYNRDNFHENVHLRSEQYAEAIHFKSYLKIALSNLLKHTRKES